MLNLAKKTALLNTEESKSSQHVESTLDDNNENTNQKKLIHNFLPKSQTSLHKSLSETQRPEVDSASNGNYNGKEKATLPPKTSLQEFRTRLLSLFNEDASIPKSFKAKNPFKNANSLAHKTAKTKSSNATQSPPWPKALLVPNEITSNKITPLAKLGLVSLSSPTMLLLSATSKSIRSSSSTLVHHGPHVTYKNNEMYSILVSMFTAALFLIFIMWRWFRMKSDLRKALREQLEIQRSADYSSERRGQGGAGAVLSSCSSSASHQNHNRWSSHYHHYRTHTHHFHHHHRLLNSAKRQKLQATAASILAQLANGEHSSPEEHQQMINTAKCCLQQLKAHARLVSHNRYRESDTLNSYFDTHHRYDGQPNGFGERNLNTTVELSCSRNASLRPHVLRPDSLSSSSSEAEYSPLGYQQRAFLNENPPSYESIIKSSSLPSYTFHFASEEKTQTNKD